MKALSLKAEVLRVKKIVYLGLLFLCAISVTLSFKISGRNANVYNANRDTKRDAAADFNQKPLSNKDVAVINSNCLIIGSMLTAFSAISTAVNAADVIVMDNEVALSKATQLIKLDPIVTERVFLDIKIANYTEESIGKNKGAEGSGRIVIGLYGKDAPLSVQRVLQTINGNGVETPNYINSIFNRVVDGVLLDMERVRGINKVSIAGTEQFEFAGNVLTGYTPILERNNITHSR